MAIDHRVETVAILEQEYPDVDENKPPMTPEERDALLVKIAGSVDIAVYEGRNHGTALVRVDGKLDDFGRRIETLEQQVLAGVHLSSPDIPIDVTPSEHPEPMMRARAMSATSEARESIRVAAEETQKQTPMIEAVVAETAKQTPMLEKQTTMLEAMMASLGQKNLPATIGSALGSTIGSTVATGVAVFFGMVLALVSRDCSALAQRAVPAPVTVTPSAPAATSSALPR